VKASRPTTPTGCCRASSACFISAVIAALLKREAASISARLDPFDPVLRRPAAAMESLAPS